MNNDLNDIKRIVQNLELDNRRLISNNEHLRSCLAEKAKKIRDDKEIKRKMKLELEDTQKENHRLEHNNEEQEAYIEEREALIYRYEKELNSLKHHVKKLNNENIELKRDLDGYKHSLNSLNQLEIKQMDLVSYTKCQDKTLKKLQLCVEQTEQALVTEKENAKKIKDDLEAYEEENRRLKLENVSLEDEIYDLNKIITNTRGLFDKTKRELVNAKDEYENYKKRLTKQCSNRNKKEFKGKAKSICSCQLIEKKRSIHRSFQSREDFLKSDRHRLK